MMIGFPYNHKKLKFRLFKFSSKCVIYSCGVKWKNNYYYEYFTSLTINTCSGFGQVSCTKDSMILTSYSNPADCSGSVLNTTLYQNGMCLNRLKVTVEVCSNSYIPAFSFAIGICSYFFAVVWQTY